MVHAHTLSSSLWLATFFTLFTLAQASKDLPASHRHYASHHHSHHRPAHHRPPKAERSTSKRPFGKRSRVWTPAQGPFRASSDGRALEPFNEASFPGWTFDHIYDIPLWDGGDRAACRTGPLPNPLKTPPPPAREDPATRPDHKRRAAVQQTFCSHGNTPVDIPDTCNTNHKRIIPTFGQIQDIVDHGIEAGKAVHMAKAQAGLPDVPPGLAAPATYSGAGAACAGPAASGDAGGADAGSGGAGGSSRLGEAAKLTKLLKRLFAPIESLVDSSIDAGKNAHLAAINAAGAGGCGGGGGGGSPAPQRRLVPSPGQIFDIVKNGIDAGHAVVSGPSGGESGSAEGVANEGAGLGSSITSLVTGLLSGKNPGFGAIEDIVNHGIGLGKQAGLTAEAVDHPSGAAQQTTGGADASQGPALARRDTDEPYTAHQVLTLVTAAFRESDAFKPAPPPATAADLPRRIQILPRAPLAPPIAMDAMAMGVRGLTFPEGMELLKDLMPVILGGLQAGTKIGVALLQFLEARQQAKAQAQAANLTAMKVEAAGLSPAMAATGAAGTSYATSASGAAGAGSAPTKSRFGVLWLLHHLLRRADETGCGGSADLCVQVIEGAFPHCRALNRQEKGLLEMLEDSLGSDDPSRTFTRTMAAHCTANCARFTQAARAREGFVDRAGRCAGNPQLFGGQGNVGVSGSPVVADNGAAASEQTPLDSARNVVAAQDPTAASVPEPYYNAGNVATDQRQNIGSTPYKRSVSTSQCHAGYESLFTNSRRPVPTYEHKLFGSVVSDPASFLHWGLVRSVSQCLTACDQTDGCVFATVYQQTFSLDNLSIQLITRSSDSRNGAASEIQRRDEDAGEGEERKKRFAGQPGRKKNSFVQGHLTCALYARCFGECEARRASGGDSPVFFERSRGFCKSKGCAHG